MSPRASGIERLTAEKVNPCAGEINTRMGDDIVKYCRPRYETQEQGRETSLRRDLLSNSRLKPDLDNFFVERLLSKREVSAVVCQLGQSLTT